MPVPQKFDISDATPLNAAPAKFDDISDAVPIADKKVEPKEDSGWFSRAINKLKPMTSHLTDPVSSPEDIDKGMRAMAQPDPISSLFVHQDPNKEVEYNTPHDPTSTADKVISGGYKSLRNNVSGMTSPANLALLGTSLLAPPVGLAIGTTQIPSMIGNTIEGGVSGYKKLKSGDYEGAAQDATTALTNAAMAAGLSKGTFDVGKDVLMPADPFNKAINPTVKALAQEGTLLKPSEIVQSRTLQGMDRLLEKVPKSAQQYKDFGDQARADIQSKVSDFQDQIGKSTPDQVADATTQGIKNNSDNFKEAASKAYDEMKSLAGDKPSEMPNLSTTLEKQIKQQLLKNKGHQDPAFIQTLSSILDDIKQTKQIETPGGVMKKPDLEQFSQDILNNYKPGNPESNITPKRNIGPEADIVNPVPTEADIKQLYAQQFPEDNIALPNQVKTVPVGKTLEQMLVDKSDFRDKVKDTNIIGNKKTGIYKQLAKSADADIKGFAEQQGGDLLDKYTKTNQMYGPGKDLFNSPMSRRMQFLAENDPQNIASAVFKKDGMKRVQMARQLLGEDHFEPLKQQFIQGLIDKATVQPKGSIDRVIQGGKLSAVQNAYGDPLLKEVLNKPGEFENFKKLANISNLSQSAVKASAAAATRSTSTGLLGPVKAAAKWVANPAASVMAKFILSPAGREFLSTHTEIPSVTPQLGAAFPAFTTQYKPLKKEVK